MTPRPPRETQYSRETLEAAQTAYRLGSPDEIHKALGELIAEHLTLIEWSEAKAKEADGLEAEVDRLEAIIQRYHYW